MLGELLVYFFGYPVGGAVAGAFFGLFSSVVATQVQISNARPECARYMHCQNEAGMCALTEKSQSTYASMSASTIQALNALADQTGQQNIANQIASVRSECEWSRNNCPTLDPSGIAACASYNQAWSSFSPVAIKALVGTIVAGSGIGLIAGTIMQIKACVQRQRDHY